MFKYTLSLLIYYYIVYQEIRNQFRNKIWNLIYWDLKVFVHSFLHLLNKKTLSLILIQFNSFVLLVIIFIFLILFFLLISSKHALSCLNNSLELLLYFSCWRNILLFVRGDSVIFLWPSIGIHDVLGILCENHSHLTVDKIC